MTDRALYLGMVGAKQAITNLQVTTNNLANVNTTGHRADIPIFSSQMITGDGLPSRYYDVTTEIKANLSHGPMMNTGKDLDAAIDGSGFFAIQTKGGLEAYTRNGNFTRNPEGFLVTANGDYVLGQRGLIAIPPAQKINIGQDGTISIQALGQSENDISIIDRLKLVNPAANDIIRGDNGMFYSAGQGQLQADNTVKVQSGFLEGSNVNAVSELVNMIESSRQFEMQIKMMKAVDDNAQKATQVIALQ